MEEELNITAKDREILIVIHVSYRRNKMRRWRNFCRSTILSARGCL